MVTKIISWFNKLSDDARKIKLGNLGEAIIVNYFNRQGIQALLSENPIDAEKDITVDGNSCEIKTQQIQFVNNTFTFKNDQHFKMMNAHRVYLIVVPFKYRSHDAEGCVYEIDMKSVKVQPSRYEDQFEFTLDQPAIKLLFKIENQDTLNSLGSLSPGTY